MKPRPELSVVVVTPGRFGQLRRTVRHLREQDIADRIELLVVCTDDRTVADARPQDLQGFGSVRCIPVGPIANVDTASASGVRAASAPVVAIIEDHAYVSAGWARAIVRAHERPVALVGSIVENANPRSMLSWVNLLLAYGAWTDPDKAGRVATCAGHNLTAKTALLRATGDQLEGLLGRGGTLISDMASSGQPLVLDRDARLAHVNPSRLSATARLRVDAGRLYGATRAADGGWGQARRALYIGLGGLIPFVRYPRLARDHLRSGPFTRLGTRFLPAVALGLLFDAAGQVLGYARGPGGSLDRLAVFEMDRMQHITRRDRRDLAEDA